MKETLAAFDLPVEVMLQPIRAFYRELVGAHLLHRLI